MFVSHGFAAQLVPFAASLANEKHLETLMTDFQNLINTKSGLILLISSLFSLENQEIPDWKGAFSVTIHMPHNVARKTCPWQPFIFRRLNIFTIYGHQGLPYTITSENQNSAGFCIIPL